MMNKLFFVFAIIVLCSSCREEEKPTTYQLFNNSNRIVTDIKYLDGTMYEVLVHHYYKTKLIQEDNIGEIATEGGKTGLMNVPANTDLFKVSFKFLPSKSPEYIASWNVRYYMIDYKIIVRGENNILGVNGGSFISDTIVKR
jgi:hypothetical protein